jgi:hypothetical protein
MSKHLPSSLNDAVGFGLSLLADQDKRELASMGMFNPHMQYDTDFAEIIGVGLGISNGENLSLLRDIATNHVDELHFLEIDGESVEVDAALRVVLSAMSKAVKNG